MRSPPAQTLQEWVQQQPHMQAVDVARMFYPGAAEASVTPPLPEWTGNYTPSYEEPPPPPEALPVAPASVE